MATPRVGETPSGRSLLATLKSARGLALVALVVLGLAVWRFAFVFSGVDPDSDAYGHHAIARQILVTPRDLSVHWVWLPLFHYLQALGVALGATLQTVRLLNVVLAAAAPVMLYVALRDHRERNPEDGPDPAPTIAALLAALSPIAMQMGTTGQSEPLFAFLVLAVVLSLDRNRPVLAAIALSSAVLLRYEAWSIPPAIAVFLLLARVPFVRARLLPHERGEATDGVRAWLPVILPALAILVWAWIRQRSDGRWFLFLEQTREFANGALGSKGSYTLDDALYYSVRVPWRVVGYPLLLVPFGVVRTFRRDGLRFFGIFSATLAFVTLTWMRRSSLGLDRHFVILVPFYATMIANGVVAIAKFADDLAKKPFAASIHAFSASGAVRAAFLAGLGVAAVGNTWTILEVWMRDWRNASEGAWPDRREIANRLRDLDGAIFCDEPTVELLSGLPRTRFDRRMLEDPRAKTWISSALATGKPVYVATWAVKLDHLKLQGPILARSPGSTGNSGFVLMRVDAM
jgi:hypothetical protein